MFTLESIEAGFEALTTQIPEAIDQELYESEGDSRPLAALVETLERAIAITHQHWPRYELQPDPRHDNCLICGSCHIASPKWTGLCKQHLNEYETSHLFLITNWINDRGKKRP